MIIYLVFILCFAGHEKQPQMPLLRLRVEYKTEEQCFNPIRFGQQYCDQVANPTDMVILRKEKSERKKNTNSEFDRETMENLLQREEVIILYSIIIFVKRKINFL